MKGIKAPKIPSSFAKLEEPPPGLEVSAEAVAINRSAEAVAMNRKMKKAKAPKRKNLPSVSTETQTDVTLKIRGEIERWIPVFAQVDTQIEEIEGQLAKCESWEVPLQVRRQVKPKLAKDL